MTTTTTSTNAVAAFVDLATYSELESYLYGGQDALTYFVRGVAKSNWFSFLPVTVKHVGTADFGQEFRSIFTRGTDYILHAWFHATLPTIASGTTNVRWINNVGHHLLKKVELKFNDLPVQEFDDTWLDINAAYRVTSSKQVGYNNMIGNVAALTQDNSGTIGQYNINVPLPLWFCEDSGIALPIAAVPFNEVAIYYELRNSGELIVSDGAATVGSTLSNVNTWIHGVVVHQDERVRMGDAPRDILMHQIQRNSLGTTFTGTPANQKNSFTLRFSHAVMAMFWVIQNRTAATTEAGAANASGLTGSPIELSNYTNTAGPAMSGTLPYQTFSLIYESTSRGTDIMADYPTQVVPYYFAPVIPEQTGYSMYSYSLDPFSVDPMGSTNHSKLTSVQLDLTVPLVALSGTYHLHVYARNWNIVRISGGSLGFPLL